MENKFNQFKNATLILAIQRGTQNCLALKHNKKQNTKLYKEAKADIGAMRYIIGERLKHGKSTFSNPRTYPKDCLVEYHSEGRFMEAKDYVVRDWGTDVVLIEQIGVAMPIKIWAKPQNLRLKYFNNIEL